MKVSEAMTQDVRVASPEETVQKAARTMASLDSGVLPVGEKDHLIGMITDRDIVIRGIAQGKGPKAKVRDVMTKDVKYCFDDQEVEEVTRNMGDIQVRRLPVLNRDKLPCRHSLIGRHRPQHRRPRCWRRLVRDFASGRRAHADRLTKIRPMPGTCPRAGPMIDVQIARHECGIVTS